MIGWQVGLIPLVHPCVCRLNVLGTLARQHTPNAIKVLAEIMDDSKAPPAARATDIAAQERDAQTHVPVHSTVSASPFVQPKKQVVTPWGLVDADLMPVAVAPKKKVQIDYGM